MLSKYDISLMTDGQREILFAGMKMERDRFLAILAEEKKLAKDLNNQLLSAKIALIEAKVKGGAIE